MGGGFGGMASPGFGGYGGGIGGGYAPMGQIRSMAASFSPTNAAFTSDATSSNASTSTTIRASVPTHPTTIRASAIICSTPCIVCSTTSKLCSTPRIVCSTTTKLWSTTSKLCFSAIWCPTTRIWWWLSTRRFWWSTAPRTNDLLLFPRSTVNYLSYIIIEHILYKPLFTSYKELLIMLCNRLIVCVHAFGSTRVLLLFKKKKNWFFFYFCTSIMNVANDRPSSRNVFFIMREYFKKPIG